MKYTRAFHLLERLLFCEGSAQVKNAFLILCLSFAVKACYFGDGINHAITFALPATALFFGHKPLSIHLFSILKVPGPIMREQGENR